MEIQVLRKRKWELKSIDVFYGFLGGEGVYETERN